MVFSFLICSCKEVPSQEVKAQSSNIAQTEAQSNSYPGNLSKVFDAHGGLDQWREYKTLSFEFPTPKFTEKQTIDLYNRMDKITTPSYSLGYDGEQIWLSDTEGTYEGDPKFYHNLMFYFYAMPFLLADSGIHYAPAAPLDVDGAEYPGFKISYDSGVGASAKDEYYLHYNPDTFQMVWLGYTVTYFSNEVSDKISWIRYGNWTKVDEVLLPLTLTWYTMENGKIGAPRKTVAFQNITLSLTSKGKAFYAKPEDAEFVD